MSKALRLMPHTLPAIPEKAKKSRARYRKTDDRGDLEFALKAWQSTACTSSPTAQFWDKSMIITNEDITKLAMAEVKKLQSTSDLIELLDESPDWALFWADRVLGIILGYNSDTGRFARRIRAKRQAARAAAGESEPEYESEERDPVSADEYSCEDADPDSDGDEMTDSAQPPWPWPACDGPIAMEEEIEALRSKSPAQDDPNSEVNNLVTAKESLVAGNSYSVKHQRHARHKVSRSDAQNRPLFSRGALEFKKETTRNGGGPLHDKTNGNNLLPTLIDLPVAFADVEMSNVCRKNF